MKRLLFSALFFAVTVIANAQTFAITSGAINFAKSHLLV